MLVVSVDRWTCPRCTRTTVVDAADLDTKVALNAVRDRHGKAHSGQDVADSPASGDTTWTCPCCSRTTSVDGPPRDAQAALDAVRDRHRKGHDGRDVDHGPEVIAALGLPSPIPVTPTPRRPPNRTDRQC